VHRTLADKPHKVLSKGALTARLVASTAPVSTNKTNLVLDEFMRYKILTLFTTLALHGNLLSAELEGTWFSCVPDMQARSPYSVLYIERSGNAHKWQMDWGQNHSAQGIVSFKKNELILYGCRAYRGETDPKCDEKKPPIDMRIDRFELTRKYKSIKFALEGSAWIRVGILSLDELSSRCEGISEKNIAKRDSKLAK
jgi:hypothetical protein